MFGPIFFLQFHSYLEDDLFANDASLESPTFFFKLRFNSMRLSSNYRYNGSTTPFAKNDTKPGLNRYEFL